MRLRQRAYVVISAAAALTFVTHVGIRIPINATSAALSYVLGVVFTATFAELPEAIGLSLVASVALNFFFLPPFYRFSIASPEDLVALLVFVGVSITVGKLSATARQQRELSLRRGREIERLYSLSRAVLLNPSFDSVVSELPIQIARAFDFSAVSLLVRDTDQIGRGGGDEMADWDEKLRASARTGSRFEDPASHTTSLSISLGSDVVGSLAVRGDPISDSAMHSLTNFCAIAIERSRMVEASNAAKLAKTGEELRATLLEAIAHEFKTPLTSVKAASGALQEGVGDEATKQELVEVINEEVNRLVRLMSDAIQMARLEGGAFSAEPRNVSVSEVVQLSIGMLNDSSASRRIVQEIVEDLDTFADPKLTSIALQQVLSNAFKYSDPGTPIFVRAENGTEGVTISVENCGPRIPEADLPRIFQRYYRSDEIRDRVPGTGVGLAIARRILESEGGRIWAENNGNRSVRFVLLLLAT